MMECLRRRERIRTEYTITEMVPRTVSANALGSGTASLMGIVIPAYRIESNLGR